METAALADDLAVEFAIRELTWKIDGEQVIPTAEDIRQTLDKMIEKLYTEPVPSQMHLGRLIVHHWKQDHFDVYLQMGQIK